MPETLPTPITMKAVYPRKADSAEPAIEVARSFTHRQALARSWLPSHVPEGGTGRAGPAAAGRSNMIAPLHTQELPADQGLNVLALCGTRSGAELRWRGYRTCGCRYAPSLQKLTRERLEIGAR